MPEQFTYAMPIVWHEQWMEKYGTIDSRQIKTSERKDQRNTKSIPAGEGTSQDHTETGETDAEKKPEHQAQRVVVTF